MQKPPLIRGFTLVEVTLALGILSFAMVSLTGLISVGLSSFRGSVNITVESQIAQAVLNQKRQTAFDTLVSPSGLVETRYYTNEGDQTEKPDAIYVARIEVNPSVDLPASGTARFANKSLARVDVRVVKVPGAENAGVDEAFSSPSTAVFMGYVPKM